jgi:hypothetical protein
LYSLETSVKVTVFNPSGGGPDGITVDLEGGLIEAQPGLGVLATMVLDSLSISLNLFTKQNICHNPKSLLRPVP